jgi:hypothetical protein
MSAFGGVIGKAVGALGGPQLAAVIVGAGLIVGAATGGAVAGGLGPGGPGSGQAQLSIYPCPDVGPPLQTVPAGQRFLVTGRSEDGTWARIHYPQPGRTEAWVQVSPLTFQASLQSVPVATCGPEEEAPSPSFEALATLTPVQNNSPSPAPTPTPTTTPAASGAPTLAKLTTSTAKISYDEGSYCPKAVKQVTFTVKGTDDVGLAGVSLYWRAPGSGSYTKAAMSLTSGTARNGTWQLSLDTTADGITKAGTLAFYAIGTDTSGATRRIPRSGADTVAVAVCSNTGPTIKSAASSSGSTLRWDPLGVGGCRTRTTISATVSDVDGVKSVTLYYRPPGSGSWSTKPMQKASGKWSATLDSAKDGITIPSPPTGTLRWYIKAVDGKDAVSQSGTASIAVRRCDSPARFDVNQLRTTSYSYCPPATPTFKLIWDFSVTDPDGLASARLSYTITSSVGPSYTGSRTITTSGPRFSITSAALDGATFKGRGEVTWTITTTDRFGGRSSASSKSPYSVGTTC